MRDVVKTVKNGALAVGIREYAGGRFGFDYTPPGDERIRVRKHSIAAAEKKAHELLGIAHAGKVQRMEIDEDEYAEFLRWRAERKKKVPVAALVSQFLAAKKKKGVSTRQLRDLEILTKFAEAHPVSVSDVTGPMVEKWLDHVKRGPRRWNNLRASIISLWRYARNQMYLPAELTTVELLEKRRVVVVVKTFTPDELKRILAVVEPHWMPAVVLSAFAGIRPEEVAPEKRGGKQGLRWENILWAKGKIDVPAAVSKTRRRRFAPLLPALAAFLQDFKHSKGFIAPDTGRLSTRIQFWAERSGVEWKQDGLRHSFASYRLALTSNLAALALEMGNSPDMIHRHYLDLKHEDEAREWFAIRPKRAKRAKHPRFSIVAA